MQKTKVSCIKGDTGFLKVTSLHISEKVDLVFKFSDRFDCVTLVGQVI